MFKISYSLDFLNNASFVNVHHAPTITLSIWGIIFAINCTAFQSASSLCERAMGIIFNNILKLVVVEAF